VIGADATQQALRAGVVDEIGVGIVPVIFGEGVRFLEHLGPDPLERTRVIETAADTDIRFRVKG
jgi:riboflavin biosynthesis pyrimidine reductase